MKLKSMVKVCIVLLLLVSFATITEAAVYNVRGIVTRADTSAVISGITVANGTNTTTTNATGHFVIANMQNDTNGWVFTFSADGISTRTASFIVNAADNDTANATVTLKMPVNSAITESGVTRDSATISWTVNDSYVANRVKYSLDSGLATNIFYTTWSNSTASPSFTLTNLLPSSVWYYQVESYNLVDTTTHSDTDTGDVTTLQAGHSSSSSGSSSASSGSSGSSGGSSASIFSPTTSTGQPNLGGLLIIGGIVALAYMYLSGSGGKRKR